MTHINPDGKAVGGPQPDEMKLLHIYSQPCEHFEARIVGNRAGLLEVKQAIDILLTADVLEIITREVFATDGEGYQVTVKQLPTDWHSAMWEKYQPHYCDRGYNDDRHQGAALIRKQAVCNSCGKNFQAGDKVVRVLSHPGVVTEPGVFEFEEEIEEFYHEGCPKPEGE